MAYKPLEKHKLKLQEVDVENASLFKKVGCPSCGSDVPAANLNINDKIAKCHNCDVLFSFHNDLVDLAAPAKQEILRPEGIDLFHYQGELDISMQQPVSIPEALLGALLPIFGLLFTLIFFLSNKDISIFLPLISSLAGFLALFNLLHRSKQKLFIHIDDRHLSIKRRPRKFLKDQAYNISEIDQLYVKNVGGQYFVYMIVDSRLGQKHIKLVSHIESTSKARYLEQEIEKQLGILDRKVPEETIS